MNKLVLTVGLPRSGKSTWAIAQGCPIVNPDSIRHALHGKPFIPSAEDFVWAIAKIMVHSLFLSGHSKVIVDATNTTKQRRNFWKSANWKREFHVISENSPGMVETCIDRAKKTCADAEHFKNLSDAITRMAKQYESVQIDEIE